MEEYAKAIYTVMFICLGCMLVLMLLTERPDFREMIDRQHYDFEVAEAQMKEGTELIETLEKARREKGSH